MKPVTVADVENDTAMVEVCSGAVGLTAQITGSATMGAFLYYKPRQARRLAAALLRAADAAEGKSAKAARKERDAEDLIGALVQHSRTAQGRTK